jgi:hypothetical protein
LDLGAEAEEEEGEGMVALLFVFLGKFLRLVSTSCIKR